MPKVSLRTLTLMLLLLASVVAFQYVSWVPTAQAGAIWLADDEPNEPSEPEPEVSRAALGLSFLDNDPNEPQPEMAVWAAGLCSDDDPNEPQPEITVWVAGLCLDNDPNEPSEPQPEVA